MQFWIMSGHRKNWERSISDNIWGVKERDKIIWERLEKGDALILYCTTPISGVIGVARLESKFKQDNPLWDDEVKKNEVIWPYRFEFKPEFIQSKSEWLKMKVEINDLPINRARGLSIIKNLNAVRELLKRLDSRWGSDTRKILLLSANAGMNIDRGLIKTPHDEIKEKLLQLGKIERFISEKEYTVPDTNERLDVVWRRVSGSVPTYVFEIQMGGNLHQALSKLKHAYDIWNSNIFLILEESDVEKVNQLIGGTYHEIKDRLKIITSTQLDKIYKLQVEDNELKIQAGLRV